MKRRVLVLLAIATVLLFAMAAQAFAAATVIDLPDEAYLSSTAKITYPIPDYGVGVTEITDGDLTVTFDSALYASASTGELWGALPYVEDPSAQASALWTSFEGTTPYSLALSFSSPVQTFGVELAPLWGNWWSELPMETSVTFKLSLDGSTVGTVNRTMSNYVDPDTGQGIRDAYLFAITSDVAFDRVEIVAEYTTYPCSGFALNQFRYSAPVPVEVEIGGETGDVMLDTFLYSYRPAGNFGNSSANFIGRTSVGEERTVLSIPLDKLEGVDVTGATLDLTKSNGTLFPLNAYRLRQTPGAASWNNYAAGSPWGLGGAKDADLDYYADLSATSGDGDFDVTALLQAAIAAGDDTLDLVIVDPAPVDRRYVGFYSSECVNAPYRPCLVVDGFVAP